MGHLLYLSFVLLAAKCLCVSDEVPVSINDHWNGGFNGKACFDITSDLHGWTVHLKFDKPVSSLQVWVADVSHMLNDNGTGTEFVLINKNFNADEHVGDQLCMSFMGHGDGDINPKATAYIEEMTVVTAAPGQTLPPTTPATVRPLPHLVGGGILVNMTKLAYQNDGHFEGTFAFPLQDYTMGWMANLTFSVPLSSMHMYDADLLTHTPDGYTWTVVNQKNRPIPDPGQLLSFKVLGNIDGTTAKPSGQGIMFNMGDDHWSVQPASTTDKSKYNYNDILFKSFLFYEAQRSGKLPASNRIPWRGDSALNDKGENGEDLTGGWYDAGDHVKFNFPMSYSTTILAWGYLLYPEAYKAAGQEDALLDGIKWPLEYLLKCHTAPEELYVQVGNPGPDHGYWGRPEDMTMPRPSYKITASRPGSDVAMETAAAMSAGYLVFKDKNSTFANTLLTHAKQLWDFGMKYKGKYSDSVSAAAGFYSSHNYTDELCWGSLWLYQATNESKYLDNAEKLWDPEPAWGMSWDEKTISNQVLLYKLTGKDSYKQAVEGTYTSWFPGGDITYTPKGLAFRLVWASLRYSSNMAMMALIAADAGIHPTEYRHWAMCQIHYALGDTGFSYVVGFGDDYPEKPHHRGSSCPVIPAQCGSYVLRSHAPNTHTLYGALVGGPGRSDDYKDDRENYQNNEVATDYNAGFTTAVAALKSLWMSNKHPEQTGSASCPYSATSQSLPVVGRR
ncbi:endoglucanase 4 [Aplysia californica]|uniref:Endoglucanase n=1 Tax=Aplysia californica TaxID=6500 RepID=A0ABM1W3G3_APLCA|nr:endoglucanase 4 [Aplysia californica]